MSCSNTDGVASQRLPKAGSVDAEAGERQTIAKQTEQGDGRSSAMSEYDALQPDERRAYMTLALANNGLLLNPPDAETGEAAVEAEQLRISARQDLIATCMVAEGFEYWPEPGEYFVSAVDDPEFEPGSRQWVEYYGFEVSTFLFLGVDGLPEGIHGYRGSQSGPGPDVDVENLPNQQYIKSLTSEEYEAYHIAYSGLTPDGAFVSGDNCEAQALEAIPEPTYLVGLTGEDRLRDVVLADPEWIAHERMMSACLVELGYEPTVSIEMLTALYEERLRQAKVLPPFDVNFDDLEDPTEVMLEWESAEWFEALRTVQLEEREHAMAFFDCGGDQQTRIDVMAAIVERIATD